MSRIFESGEEFLEWLEDFEVLPESDKKVTFPIVDKSVRM